LLGTAVTYGLNQWEKLTRFLQDGRIELSNNLDTTDTAAIEALLPWNIKLPK
ncbi:MAG: IS66 family transposase, partial [Acidobacteria bacterium]|nr:IS66 family transposase [Acidobacteriota bacterium]